MSTCDNKDCCVSTGICGSLTFGTGELDDNGYWENPCVHPSHNVTRQNEAIRQFKKQFAELLVGPTCLNNAERLTDSLFQSNNAEDIAKRLSQMSEEFLTYVKR